MDASLESGSSSISLSATVPELSSPLRSYHCNRRGFTLFSSISSGDKFFNELNDSLSEFFKVNLWEFLHFSDPLPAVDNNDSDNANNAEDAKNIKEPQYFNSDNI